MNYITTITKKGQIAIPEEMRRLLGLKLPDKVQLSASATGVVIRPLPKSLQDIWGIVGTKRRVLNDHEMRKDVLKLRARRQNTILSSTHT